MKFQVFQQHFQLSSSPPEQAKKEQSSLNHGVLLFYLSRYRCLQYGALLRPLERSSSMDNQIHTWCKRKIPGSYVKLLLKQK